MKSLPNNSRLKPSAGGDVKSRLSRKSKSFPSVTPIVRAAGKGQSAFARALWGFKGLPPRKGKVVTSEIVRTLLDSDE